MPRVLVIGPLHIDAIGDFEPDVLDLLDKPGVVRLCLGGSGFNVAANLAWHGHDLSFLTAIARGSVAEHMLQHVLVRQPMRVVRVTPPGNGGEPTWLTRSTADSFRR